MPKQQKDLGLEDYPNLYINNNKTQVYMVFLNKLSRLITHQITLYLIYTTIKKEVYMTKFLMTTTDEGVPVSINTDMIIAIEDTGDGCWVLTSKWNYKLSEPYEQVIKRLTPFVSVEEMTNNDVDSEWLHNYLKDLPKGVSLLVNDSNG